MFLMSTEFSDGNGNVVARRWWGGDSRGVVVEILPCAAIVEMGTELFGDDGTRESLRSLAEGYSGAGSEFESLLQATARAENVFDPGGKPVIPENADKIHSTRIVSLGDGEWKVAAYAENGRRLAAADYFTSDRDDAISTAIAMERK